MAFLGVWVLCIAHLSIILNGTPKGFFPATTGLRQGDPLSPLLFILIADSWSRILRMAENKGLLKGFQVGFDKVNVSHLQFANDTLIYLEGEENNVKVLKSLIKCFALSLWYTVNWSKSHLSGIGLFDSECMHVASLSGVLTELAKWLSVFTTRRIAKKQKVLGSGCG